ncbi:conserved domain protein [Klebsiella sp. MS 92-3]|nr:conserved domain protein [Klebsiella sp. MS 92-3]
MDGSSGTPYQTVQPKDVLEITKPPSGGFENGNVYRAACYAGSHQRRGEVTIAFLFIFLSCHEITAG